MGYPKSKIPNYFVNLLVSVVLDRSLSKKIVFFFYKMVIGQTWMSDFHFKKITCFLSINSFRPETTKILKEKIVGSF